MKHQSNRYVRNHFNLLLSILFSFFLVLLFNNCKQIDSQAAVNENLSLATENPSELQPVSGPVSNPIVVSSPVVSTKVKALVALGNLDRTMISCDDGLTWVKNRTVSETGVCGYTAPQINCSHHAGTATSLDYGDGYFYKSLGWGAPNTVWRSSDGFNWEKVRDLPGITTGGLVYVSNQLHLGGLYSPNQGVSWTNVVKTTDSATFPNDYYFIRKADNQTIGLFGRSSGIVLSHNQGRTWMYPSSYDPKWAGSNDGTSGGFIKAKNMLLTVGIKTDPTLNQIYAAKSLDNGITWTGVNIISEKNSSLSPLLFDGTHFVTWTSSYGVSKMLKSLDGENWTVTNIMSGKVGRNVFRTARGVYITTMSEYTGQEIYRSQDGLNWVKVPVTNYKQSHSIRVIVEGEVPSSMCQ